MKSSLEIAREARLKPIADVARELGLADDEIELYGTYKAKVSPLAYERRADQPDMAVAECMHHVWAARRRTEAGQSVRGRGPVLASQAAPRLRRSAARPAAVRR